MVSWLFLVLADEEQQNMPQWNMPLWHVDYFELSALEKQQIQGDKYWEFLLNSQSLPIDGFSKSNSVVINSLPRSCINQGKLTHVTGKETRNDITPRPLCHKLFTPPIYSSKDPFVFPKRHLLSSKKPIFPFSFSIKMMFKLEF